MLLRAICGLSAVRTLLALAFEQFSVNASHSVFLPTHALILLCFSLFPPPLESVRVRCIRLFLGVSATQFWLGIKISRDICLLCRCSLCSLCTPACSADHSVFLFLILRGQVSLLSTLPVCFSLMLMSSFCVTLRIDM